MPPYDANNIGQGRQYDEAVDAYDAQAGKYEEQVKKIAPEERTQESEMPKAPDPNPFTLGPMAPSGRGE